MLNEIFGVSFTHPSVNNFEDKFEYEQNDFEQKILVSKEIFTHKEDDLEFKYRYVIECTQRYWENKDDYLVQLHFVICPESLNEKYKAGVMECAGLENPNDILVSDLLMYGGADISFGEEIAEEDELEAVFLATANVFESMDSIRGFYIDRYWNQIGSTGWDTINHAVKGDDLFKPAFDRMSA